MNSTQKLENPFDNCGLQTLDPSTNTFDIVDTKWSVVYTLNAVVYTLLTFFTCCLTFSIFVPILAFCGSCGLCCTQLAHFSAIVVTGVFRYSDEGEKCAKNETTLDKWDDKSFKEIGDEMEAIFISQCVLYFFYTCCLTRLLYIVV